MTVLRPALILGVACSLVAALAACDPSTTAAASPPKSTTATVTPTATASAAGQTSSPATVSASALSLSSSSAAAPPAAPSAPTTPAAKCASAAGSLPHSSITVCPAAAPVGAVVHVTIKGCAPVDPAAGLPETAAAALFFLGSKSWLGTDGGGGADVQFTPRTGSTEASATFTIPATYLGGDTTGAPYPMIKTTPGTGYEFATDPAGLCTVHFTVTGT